jgi:hypothetical protein
MNNIDLNIRFQEKTPFFRRKIDKSVVLKLRGFDLTSRELHSPKEETIPPDHAARA